MSLAFLSKKSWHTANLRNVEKVWIAEQKHAAEEKKVAELRKNIEEERQLQELRQLQAAQGDKSAALERLDWMYEGPSAAREKTAEEFLLGKEYKGEDETAAKGDLDLSTTTKYGSLALSKSALPANDAFQRLNEDPMMLIRKRQQAAREQVLKNPVKMKRIKDEVDRVKEDKKARKKAKKVAKKERKQVRREEKRRLKKKRKHGDDDSDATGVSGDEDEEKAGHRHKAYPAKQHRGHGRDRERGRSRSRSKSRSRSPVDARHGGDRGRCRLRHGDRESERGESSPTKRRPVRSSEDLPTHERRERSSSRGRRSSSPTRGRRHRSRSRSPRRQVQRDRSRSTQGRDDFGRDRPLTRRSVDRPSKTPLQREHNRDTSRRHGDRQERNRSRSPVDRRERRRSRSPADRRERRRSRSPVDRRNRHHSRSSDRRRDTEPRRSSSRRESTRREQSSRHRSSSRDRARDFVDVRGGDHGGKESESRRKPLDTEGKYGLISKAGAMESKDVDKTSLGPNAKYLAKAREAKRLEEEERRLKLGKSSRRESSELTDEEKKRMAQQMVEDAKQRDDYITKRATLKKDELDKREQEATSSNPEFLRKLHSEAYLDDESNMSDRLRRNAHYIQRKADASNFLSK
ncbi:RNA-splicing factor [Phytophthora pseudosyringae]|uniref:RNA-splicing factor n=1 Tax=Phytophthora pseudosyringae TaxID=221518 RepID=A0A8T1WPL8_9STRA|nr:RNA-splicing factor [Phytophthora pseudosyringae]